jgi:hypothetical protein
MALPLRPVAKPANQGAEASSGADFTVSVVIAPADLVTRVMAASSRG